MGLAFIGHGGGEQDDVAAFLRPRQEVVHVVAQDVQALGHGGVGVLHEDAVGALFLAGEHGELGHDGLAGVGGKVVLGVHLVIQHADAEDGEEAERAAAAGARGDEDEGARGDGLILAIGGFEHFGAGRGNGEREGVFLLLGQQQHVELFLHLVLADERGEGFFGLHGLGHAGAQFLEVGFLLGELQVKVFAVVLQGGAGGAQGGAHLLAQGHGDGVLGAGALGNLRVFEVGFVVGLELGGDGGVVHAGVDGEQHALAAAFLQGVVQGGGQFLLQLGLGYGGLDGLGGGKVGAEGGLGVAHHVGAFLGVAYLAVHLGELAADFLESGADEGVGLAGGFALFFLGVFVVGGDELVEDVLGLGGVVAGDAHFEQGGLLLIRAHHGEGFEQGAGGFQRGGVVHHDGGAGHLFIHVGGGVHGEGGEGERQRGAEAAFHAHGEFLGVGVGEGEAVVALQGDFDAAGARGADVAELHEQRALLVEVHQAQALLLPVGGVELELLDHALHEGGGFEHVAFVGQVGRARVGPQLGEDAVCRADVFGGALILHDEAGGLLVHVALLAGKVVGRSPTERGAEDDEEPEAANGGEYGLQRERILFFFNVLDVGRRWHGGVHGYGCNAIWETGGAGSGRVACGGRSPAV